MQPTDIEERPTPEETPWYANTLVWALVFSVLILALRFVPYEPLQNVLGSLSWLTHEALKIAKALFKRYGYLTIFLAPLCENTIFLGALIPGTLIMLLGGLSAHDGLISVWFAIPLGIVGAWIGDTISYGIGRFGWQRLGSDSRLVRAAEDMRGPLLSNSSWLIILYHFAGYSRLIGPAASGFFRVPLRRWMLLDYTGSALWVVAFVLLGYLLGVFGLSLDATEHNVRIVEVLLFALAIISISFVLYRSNKKKEEAAVS